MKSVFLKTAGMALLVVGMGGLLLADGCITNGCVDVPEIDATSAGNALALLAGAVLMIRGRKK